MDRNDYGLYTAIYQGDEIDKMVEINRLKEVSDPVYLSNGFPTEKGLLSLEIFGTSSEERRNIVAYIDLKYRYMSPLHAKKLKTYDSRLYKILFGQTYYKLIPDTGELVEVEDSSEGGTGAEFLYKIWDKVKKKEKSSLLTKEVEESFNLPAKKLFISKFLVIPVIYRDIRDMGGTKMGLAMINDKYSQIISLTQNMKMFSDFDQTISSITQARVQLLLIDIYDMLYSEKYKGVPAKRGFHKNNILGKPVINTSRLIITARNLNVDSVDDIQVKFHQIGLPLAHICSNFYPFILYELKLYFDNEFIRAGRYPYISATSGEIEYCTVKRSYTEEEITEMLENYIETPAIRFDPVYVPETDLGPDKKIKMRLTGRIHKNKTTFNRNATWTDIIYIAATNACSGKHDLSTRYPLLFMDAQWAGEVVPLSTIKTEAVYIGDDYYPFFPVCEGDPVNKFIEVQQFSNGHLSHAGGDHDGDQYSNKCAWSHEANLEAGKMIDSISYLLTMDGILKKKISREFVLTAYSLTVTDDLDYLTSDPMEKKYRIKI